MAGRRVFGQAGVAKHIHGQLVAVPVEQLELLGRSRLGQPPLGLFGTPVRLVDPEEVIRRSEAGHALARGEPVHAAVAVHPPQGSPVLGVGAEHPGPGREPGCHHRPTGAVEVDIAEGAGVEDVHFGELHARDRGSLVSPQALELEPAQRARARLNGKLGTAADPAGDVGPPVGVAPLNRANLGGGLFRLALDLFLESGHHIEVAVGEERRPEVEDDAILLDHVRENLRIDGTQAPAHHLDQGALL